MGFFDKIKAGLEKTRRQMGGVFAEFTGENEEFFDELEEALIVADAGADTAFKAVSSLRDMVRDRSLLGRDEVKAGLVEVLSDIIQVVYFKKTHGKRFFRMAPLHHHLELGGWSETKLFCVFSGATLVLCVLAFLGVMNRYPV